MKNWTHTERGESHSKNEDYLVCQSHPGSNANYLCFIADGQGGRPNGALASKIACQAGLEAALSTPFEELQSESRWTEIICRSDMRVSSLAEGGLTTLIGLTVSEQGIFGASVGDSMALVFDSDGELFVATESQKKSPPIGSSEAVPVAFFKSFGPSSLLTLMTDGVWKYAGVSKITAILSGVISQQSIPMIRSSAALQTGNLPDDFSIVLVSSH
ncbi:MAG: protein phosphatase 2C domain-containing protein [Verrucomicrobiota bacterium]